MSLHLIEFILPPESARDAVFERIESAADAASAELIEVQVALDMGRLYAIVEHDSDEALEVAYREGGLGTFAVTEVRLVGPTLDEVKAARGDAGYLVEWDLPAGLAMEDYIARKRRNAPGYAEVPETTFLRTYVCIDMSKCLCFYDAPDEAAVLRARQAVDTPVTRVGRVAEVPQRVRA